MQKLESKSFTWGDTVGVTPTQEIQQRSNILKQILGFTWGITGMLYITKQNNSDLKLTTNHVSLIMHMISVLMVYVSPQQSVTDFC